MRKLHAILALWMALSVTAVAQIRNASVSYTYQNSVLRGFRVGDELMLPIDKLSEIGWTISVSGGNAKVIAENTTLNLPIKEVNGEKCLPMRAALEKLGGSSQWIPGGYDALEVHSPVKEITVKRGQLQIETTLNVNPNVSLLSNPTRVIIDLDGARLRPETKLNLDTSARVTQYRPNTVRVVIEMAFTPQLPPQKLEPAKGVMIDFNPPNATGPDVPAVVQPRIDPIVPTGQMLLPLALVRESETQTVLSLKFPTGIWKGAATYRKPENEILEIVLPGLLCELPKGFRLDTELITDTSLYYENGSSVVRLELKRAMGVDLSSDALGIAITLVRPSISDGKLAGKIIVIDPGHGGIFPGTGNGSYTEKVLTLKLGMVVRDYLLAEGATVIMTRTTDRNLKAKLTDDLTERASMGNRSNAHVFISLHFDSPGKGRKSPSGTKTFYHGGRSLDRFLAECLQKEFANAKMLPNIGVKDDHINAPENGYAVLNRSKMPAVLVECGFVDHPTDRVVIQTEEFRRGMAKAIVKGLKIYFGQ